MKPMTGNFQVWGPPGCGKTTFIQNQVEKLHENGDKVLLCSLTRAAAGEMLSRNMKTGDESIGTLHKHCYHALGRPALTEDHLKEFNEFCQSERGDSSLQLSEFEYLGFRPEDTRNIREGSFTFEEITRDPHSGDYWRERMDCLRARMVPPELWPDPVTRFATCWQAWKEATGYMDFTDLIERGGWDCLPPGHPDVLIVDEAQDISKLEMECVVKQWGIHTRAVMLVGDPYQCLYEWRGSTPDVFLRPEFEVPEDHKKLLSRSFRVPGNVYEVAMKWIRNHGGFVPFEYQPREFIGKVFQFGATFHRDHVEKIIRHAEKKIGEGKTVMFLASCGYMLVDLIRMLREKGISYHNPYAEARKEWNPLGHSTPNHICARERLLAYLRHDRETWGKDSRLWTFRDLNLWAEVISSEGVFRHGAKRDIEELSHQIPDAPITPEDALNFFREENFYELNGSDLEAFERHLMPSRVKSFSYLLRLAKERGPAVLRETPSIVIGTIHSVKGAEADVVYLAPDLSPAGEVAWHNQAQRDSVIRQFYVGMTRAREELYICRAQTPVIQLLA